MSAKLAEAAQHVGAAATVTMHEIGFGFLQVLRQSVGERQVEVAGTEQVTNGDGGGACRRVDARARRAHQRTVVAASHKRRYQVDHLLRTAIEMASGFDMQYFHQPENNKRPAP